ncbi:caffeic acid 3-O-methyltransferase-like [Glycine soja]|uniref:caffeic acid 3-O-methyltransferase-like n=1 Tax=Glycine soja TaxID=3848 RepID=UPI001038C1D4|nr:caffeic acid 3-O-methyltransferase-like [Glycine soja]
MKDAILEGGIPFNRDHGKHVFEYSNMNPSFNQLFMAAMTNRATLIMKKIVECYMGFEHINRLVDVGGGLGLLTLAIGSYDAAFAVPQSSPPNPPHQVLESLLSLHFFLLPSSTAVAASSAVDDQSEFIYLSWLSLGSAWRQAGPPTLGRKK